MKLFKTQLLRQLIQIQWNLICLNIWQKTQLAWRQMVREVKKITSPTNKIQQFLVTWIENRVYFMLQHISGCHISYHMLSSNVFLHCVSDFPMDCSELFDRGEKNSGVYTIKPNQSEPFSVYCEMGSGGWDSGNQSCGTLETTPKYTNYFSKYLKEPGL